MYTVIIADDEEEIRRSLIERLIGRVLGLKLWERPETAKMH